MFTSEKNGKEVTFWAQSLEGSLRSLNTNYPLSHVKQLHFTRLETGWWLEVVVRAGTTKDVISQPLIASSLPIYRSNRKPKLTPVS